MGKRDLAPRVGAVGLLALVDAIVRAQIQQYENDYDEFAGDEQQFKDELIRQYNMGWDISPVRPMSSGEFLRRMRL